MFEAMIWAGTALTLAGLAGLVWCIVTAMRLRRGTVPQDAARARMQRIMAVNMGALAASTIGLMLVVAGIMLG